MRTHSLLSAVLCLCLAFAGVAVAQSCPGLEQAKPSGATDVQAAAVAASGDLPAFCRVTAVLRPSTDSEIHIEVWLPDRAAWNGKYQAVGNGGWGGSINTAEMATALSRGYATSSTDTGHTGGRATFAMGHPEKLVDFGYRAVHEMTVAAKSLIARYYGAPAKLAYFQGCSSGGRQALMEAQRFPEDYDGIVAGATTNNFAPMMVGRIWVAQATLTRLEDYIQPELYPVIHRAVLSACPSHAGVLDDPLTCRFDPAVLACKSGQTSDCLTPPQVRAAERIYTPATNPRTGQIIFPPMERGSELVWKTLAGGPEPIQLANDYFRYVVFNDSNWDFRKLNFDSDVQKANAADHGVLSATDANLRPFFSHGGKLLQYHGWTDQQVMPENSINYFNAVRATVGSAAETSHVLYVVPGMNHCGGGDGPSHFDMLTAMEAWRERGVQPGTIPAAHMTDGKVDRTRNLCAYPQISRYKGTGSESDAASYTCVSPR